MDLLNSYPPDILVHSTSSTVVPSTSIASTTQPISTSNNWQEQSFDSSIVTESHYDASFESEIPPMGLSIDRGLGQNGASNIESMPINQVSSGISMSSQPCVSNTEPLTTSQRQQKNVRYISCIKGNILWSILTWNMLTPLLSKIRVKIFLGYRLGK